jgi:hypothetical protein
MNSIAGALAGLVAIWRELRVPGVKRSRNEQAIARGRGGRWTSRLGR